MKINKICFFVLLFCLNLAWASDSYPPTYETLKALGLVKNLEPADLEKKILDTSAGRIACYETSGKSVPLLLIHGNSASKEYFIKQLDGLGKELKMIAVDLPGHGESDNAKDPQKTYSMSGYAEVMAEVIGKLGFPKVVVGGWSLGGHIGYAMMDQFPNLLKGIVTFGSPPLEHSSEGLKAGFLSTYTTTLGLKQEPFTLEDAKSYMTQGIIDLDQYAFLAKASMRTDGNARCMMIGALVRGEGVNERDLVAKSPIPLGLIPGLKEHAVNNAYIDSLSYANLVMKESLEGGHDCHWSHSDTFNGHLRRFVQLVDKGHQ